MKPEEKKGLDNATIALMTAVALFYDVLQILLALIFLGWLILPIAYLTFFVWFKIHGLNFLSLKRAPTIGVGFLLEFISAGIIPAITFAVLRVALDSKMKKIIGKIPGGQMASGALANKMGVARVNSGPREQQSETSQTESPKRSGTQPLYSVSGGKGNSKQRMDEGSKNQERAPAQERAGIAAILQAQGIPPSEEGIDAAWRSGLGQESRGPKALHFPGGLRAVVNADDKPLSAQIDFMPRGITSRTPTRRTEFLLAGYDDFKRLFESIDSGKFPPTHVFKGSTNQEMAGVALKLGFKIDSQDGDRYRVVGRLEDIRAALASLEGKATTTGAPLLQKMRERVQHQHSASK